MTNRTLSFEDILYGVGHGRMQSVGHMGVVPLVDEGDAEDDYFEAPNLRVGNRNYGNVDLDHQGNGPTIVPPGAGWVVRQSAQDHAIGSGVLMRGGEHRNIDTAFCIEESQGGYISQGDHDMLVLPAAMRTQALAMRNEREFGKLWESIRQFNRSCGVSQSGGHLVYFLRQFEKELDEFVAEFELVPRQVGAIILIGGRVVGIERAPTVAFWERLWVPLVRVCYGSMAIQAAKLGLDPAPRVGLDLENPSLDGLMAAMQRANARAEENTNELVTSIKGKLLGVSPTAEDRLDAAKLLTVATPSQQPEFAGQLVEREGRYPYLSLVTA